MNRRLLTLWGVTACAPQAALDTAGASADSKDSPSWVADWTNTAVAFSIDSKSASVGVTGSGNSPMLIEPGSVLTPNNAANPNHPSPYFRDPVALGGRVSDTPQYPPISIGSTPGVLATDEVDALSYISWRTWFRTFPQGGVAWYFSVDAKSKGGKRSDMYTQMSAGEGTADVFLTVAPNGTLAPGDPYLGNVVDVEGDLDSQSADFSLGALDESAGDNLDAFAMVPNSALLLTFFSLDPTSAARIGASGATILWNNPSPVFTITAGLKTYTTPAQIGLFDKDDISSLVIYENAVTGYQASGGTTENGQTPDGNWYVEYWNSGGSSSEYTYLSDRILFTLTRESPTVGTPDANGIIINACDVLMATPGGGPPTIVAAGEPLGCRTVRNPTNGVYDMRNTDAIDALEAFGEFSP